MIQKPRGTKDLHSQELVKFNNVKNELIKVAKLYGFAEIQTPIFEHAELFTRSVGEASDIVSKEMYKFQDQSDRQLVLRPEGTAPVIRAITEDKLWANNNLKLFYFGPMFRYERPQKGRFRQFHQFGIEVLSHDSITVDAEVIAFANAILKIFKIKNVVLSVNNLGSVDTRIKFNKELKTYFHNHSNDLCDDCKNRIDKNALRILDCKIDKDKDIVKNAPSINQFLDKSDVEQYKQLLSLLKQLGIKFIEKSNLVRGLDYYSNFAFEFDVMGKDNAQSTVIGGGRYAHILKEMGGPDKAGIGFAIGVERLIDLAEDNGYFANIKEECPKVYVAGLTDLTKTYIVVEQLRNMGIEVLFEHKLIKASDAISKALKANAQNLIIIGDKETSSNKYSVKNLATKETKEGTIEQIIQLLS